MQLDIYKALKSINIEEQLVSSVIQSMEAHIDSRISQVAQPILAKLDAFQTATTARFDALQTATTARFDALQSGTSAKLDSLQGSLGSKIDAMAQIKSETEKAADVRAQRLRWIAGTAVAAVTATLAVLKAAGLL